MFVAVAVTTPRFTPACNAAPVPMSVTLSSFGAFLSTVFKSVYRWCASAIPSTTAWAASLRSTRPTLASSVASDAYGKAARESAAAALRKPVIVTFDASPTPTRIVTGPLSAGTT